MNSFRHLKRYTKELENCSACGQCVPVCPLWEQRGDPAASPRALLALLRAWFEGEITDAELAPHLHDCVMCGLCDAHCPAKLPITAIFMAARHDLGPFKKGWPNFLVECLLPYPRILDAAWHTGMLLSRSANKLRKREKCNHVHSVTSRQRKYGKGGIALFAGCIAHFGRPNLLSACMQVLDIYELDWHMPDFACCGAFAAIAGRGADVRSSVRLNLRLFDALEPDYILTLCPHCLIQIRESWPGVPWLGEDERKLALYAARRTMGIGQFLNNLETAPAAITQNGRSIYWHEACVQSESESRAIMNLMSKAGFSIMGQIAGCCGNILDGGAWPGLAVIGPRLLQARKEKGSSHSARSCMAENLKRKIEARAPMITAESCPGCLIRVTAGNMRHWLELLVNSPKS